MQDTLLRHAKSVMYHWLKHNPRNGFMEKDSPSSLNGERSHDTESTEECALEENSHQYIGKIDGVQSRRSGSYLSRVGLLGRLSLSFTHFSKPYYPMGKTHCSLTLQLWDRLYQEKALRHFLLLFICNLTSECFLWLCLMVPDVTCYRISFLSLPCASTSRPDENNSYPIVLNG